MWIIQWLKGHFCKPEESTMSQISASTIQKKAIMTLHSATVIDAVVEKLYTAPSADDINAAVTEFVTHLTLNDEDAVRQTCGENFDAIAAAFADQSGVVATALADQVAADAKEVFKAEVQAYAEHLQYKHSEDDGQAVPEDPAQ